MKRIVMIILLFVGFGVKAQTKVFDNLLHKYVNTNGWVNYNGFKTDENVLDTYLTFLENQKVENLPSAKAKKAMWINAYNAYTIKLILNNYPLKSILDVKENGKGAWDIPFVKVGGKTYTLNHIEHEILRKQYADPRIHVGVNCASFSCPALPNHAFSVHNMEDLLNKGIKSFINDKQRNNITETKIELSQIFNWFKDDFTRKTDLITFINQYSNIKIKKDAAIVYKEYNWNLNKQK